MIKKNLHSTVANKMTTDLWVLKVTILCTNSDTILSHHISLDITTRDLYLNLYLHVYLNKIHIKNGKYVVFTMSWPDDAHPTWLKFYLKSVELKYITHFTSCRLLEKLFLQVNFVWAVHKKFTLFCCIVPIWCTEIWLSFVLIKLFLNTHIRCASLQISQEEWYLCNPVIFPFRGHKFILSLTLLYPMIYDDLIWYQNWYIVSWPLIH
jgi:hypothetical protein